LNDQIKTVADELSRKGYVVMVPDLYEGKVTSDPNVAGELLKALSTDRALNELSATYAHLRSIPAVGSRPIGSIGFCMGGGLSLRLAMREPELNACVVCYGRPETDPAKLQPMNAHVLGIYGGKDTGIPTSLVEEFWKTMQSIGKSATIKTYPEAGHGFMNPDNPSHRPDDTKDAWSRIDAFFAERLKPPTAKLLDGAKRGTESGKP
jgi:carboxymethylenebutenolidase